MGNIAIEAMEILFTALGVVVSIIYGWPAFKDMLDKRHLSKVPTVATDEGVSLEKIKTMKRIVVGCIPFPPLIDYDRKAKAAVGLYAKMFDTIASANDMECVFVPIRNGDAIKALNERKVDVIACLLETSARSKVADFTALLHVITLNAVVKTDKDYHIDDLRDSDLRVVIVKGEVGAWYAERKGLTTANGRLIELDTDNVSAIFDFVESGGAEIAITDGLTCAAHLAKKKAKSGKFSLKLGFSGADLLMMPCGLMIADGSNALKVWLDTEIRKTRGIESIALLEGQLMRQFGTHIKRA